MFRVGSVAKRLGPWWQCLPVPAVAALFLLDLFFVAMSVAYSASRRWNIAFDHSYAEFYGYGKAIVAASLLVLAYRATWQRPYVAVAFVLALIAIDDSLKVHETVGEWLPWAVSLETAPFGLRPVDIGELTVWAFLGLICAFVLRAGYRAGDELSREALLLFVALLFLLVVTVAFDMTHVTLSQGWKERVVAYAEDGGELVVLSAMLGLALTTYRRAQAARARSAA